MKHKSNVIYLICHDLGQHIGAYGINTVHTPNLDKLAAQGVMFENSICTAPQCSPSRAALMTGRYPHCNGVVGISNKGSYESLNPDEKPMVNIFAENGYDTFKFGQQHATYKEEMLNFMKRHPGKDCRDVARDFESFIYGRKTEEFSKPFFAHIGFAEPHRPFDYGGISPDKSLGVIVPPYLEDTEAAREEFALYQGAIRKMDESVGKILDCLDTCGFGENTLIVFTTDHGSPFPFAKCTLYDAGIKTVLIMKYNRKGISGNKIYKELISNVDVLPAILEATNIEIPQRVQGKSFWPLLTGGMYEKRTEVFAEMTYHKYYDPMRAIRTERYKLIYNFEHNPKIMIPGDSEGGPVALETIQKLCGAKKEYIELYDLKDDPYEKENLAEDTSYNNIKTDLLGVLYQWMQDTSDPILDGPIPSAAYVDRLRVFKEMCGKS